VSQRAITVHRYYARLIATGQKTLELRSKRLLSAGQRVVVCSSAPRAVTVCECECTAVHRVADLCVADVLFRACVRPLDPRQKIALQLKVIRQLPARRVRGNFGVWQLRTQRHSKDAGYVIA
jgi:hypothetical protein